MHYTHDDSRVTEEAIATYQYRMDYGHYGAQEIAQALVTPIMYSLRYVSGPTCRGSVSLCVPPLSYKREVHDVTRHIHLHALTLTYAHLDPT
jgi:hypothetical protein